VALYREKRGTAQAGEAADRAGIAGAPRGKPRMGRRSPSLRLAMGAPRFAAGVLRRPGDPALIVRQVRLAHVSKPAFPPNRSAGDALSWLESR
jgi:hypothetical protein